MAKDLCKLINDITDMPIALIRPDGEIDFQVSALQMECSLSELSKGLVDKVADSVLLRSQADVCRPVIKITDEYLFWGAVPCSNADEGFYFLGPCPHITFPDDMIFTLIERCNVNNAERFIDCMKYRIPRVTGKLFAGVCNLLYYYEWGIPNALELAEDTIVSEPQSYTLHNMILSDILQQEFTEPWAVPLDRSQELLEYIVNGDTKAAVLILNSNKIDVVSYSAKFNNEQTDMNTPKNTNKQLNVKIARMVLCSLASFILQGVTGNGFSERQAWQIWYYYVDKAFDMDNASEIIELISPMVVDFAERQAKYIHPVSDITQKSVAYIKAHLTDDISSTVIAAQLGISTRRLNDVFNADMHTSITHFIQKERVNAAKVLLIYSNHSLADIGFMMKFSSQSYFTNIFKKIVGVTPQTFRNLAKSNQPHTKQ